MKQMSLDERGFERRTKRTRNREFLDEMNLVVQTAQLSLHPSASSIAVATPSLAPVQTMW